MKNYTNIERSTFRKSEYVGYGDGVWKIVKYGDVWYAHHVDNKYADLKEYTLASLSSKLKSYSSSRTVPMLNPVIRAKRKTTKNARNASDRTGEKPSARLVARRVANVRKGYFPNPNKKLPAQGIPGAFDYVRIDTSTLRGIREAEKFNADGWRTITASPFSTLFERAKVRKTNPGKVVRLPVRGYSHLVLVGIAGVYVPCAFCPSASAAQTMRNNALAEYPKNDFRIVSQLQYDAAIKRAIDFVEKGRGLHVKTPH